MGMSKVFLDTNIFIYLIEDKGINGRKAAALLERMTARRDSVYTSTLTLGEVLTLPLHKGDAKLADQYERILTSPGVHLLDFDRIAARIYAGVRLDKSVKAPDAMQLSIAAAAQCDLFVTNDDRLSRKIVPGIHFVSGLDKVPL
jgi:predicted nucleic acid-binding protein